MERGRGVLADQGDDVVARDQLGHGGRRLGGLAAIVLGEELDRTPQHAAGVVELVGSEESALASRDREGRGRAGQRARRIPILIPRRRRPSRRRRPTTPPAARRSSGARLRKGRARCIADGFYVGRIPRAEDPWPKSPWSGRSRTSGAAKEAFERKIAERGNIPNMYRVFAHRPWLLTTMDAHFAAVMGSGTVPLKLKEMLALQTSLENRSRYCASSHTILRRANRLDARSRSPPCATSRAAPSPSGKRRLCGSAST